MRIVPEIQCQVAILSKAIALLVLRVTGHLVRQQHSSLVMVTCSLELTLVRPHSMASHLIAAILQHLEVTRLGGINLQTNSLSRPPLALAMTIITNSSNRNNNQPQELPHLLMPVHIITASLLLTLRKVMVILHILSRLVGSKLMITLVIRTKGSSSRPILSRLDMISKAMAQLVMDQLQTQLRMVLLLRAMVVQVGLVKHLQGNRLQLQLLEATLVILPNHLPVLHQATRHKVLSLHLATLRLRHRLAMEPNPQHRAAMARAHMGSLPRVRNHLHLLLMDRQHLLDLLRLVMGSMVTASQATVHPHLTLVHPLQATLAMASSSHTVILMAPVAMGSPRRILLKLQLLLHPKTLPLHLHLPQQMLLLLLLPTVVRPKPRAKTLRSCLSYICDIAS